ncbi:hypothetical protein ACIGO9_29710 [Nocardia asteroides]|uniref:hypothetical protein n=1 Tax=Nocardia asteroides TaxID=1824 RepID=UPI0037C6182A
MAGLPADPLRWLPGVKPCRSCSTPWQLAGSVEKVVVMDLFWENVEEMLARAQLATDAEQVIAMLNEYGAPSAGDAFFPGSGGDRQLSEALAEGGWSINWLDGTYRWVATDPNRSSALEYIEGDVSKRDPAPAVVEAVGMAVVSAPVPASANEAGTTAVDVGGHPAPGSPGPQTGVGV